MRKATLHRPINHVAAVAVVLSAICANTSGQVPCQYEVTLFYGPDGCNGPVPLPVTRGISEAADIVGYYRSCNAGPQRAFVWNEDAGLQTLDTLPGITDARAYDLIDPDFIVGTMRTGVPNHAILWQQGVPLDLGIPPGGDSAEALAVNSKGQITGYWGSTVNGGWHAFLWDGEMIDLGADFPTQDSRAFDVNERTQLTGWMGTAVQIDAHAFLWENGRVIDLGVIPRGFTSEGRALNDNAEVVGVGFLPYDKPPGWVRHAFYWADGVALDMGTLPECLESRATGINNSGVAIGYCDDPGLAAFVWHDGVMTRLNDLIPPELGLQVQIAFAINDTGQIAAFGPDANFNRLGMLLTPVEPPIGDLDNDCQIGVADLLTLLSNWGPCQNCTNCPADLDNNCVVGVSDLLILLGNWS